LIVRDEGITQSGTTTSDPPGVILYVVIKLVSNPREKKPKMTKAINRKTIPITRWCFGEEYSNVEDLICLVVVVIV
jgi:hypothetical protein